MTVGATARIRILYQLKEASSFILHMLTTNTQDIKTNIIITQTNIIIMRKCLVKICNSTVMTNKGAYEVALKTVFQEQVAPTNRSNKLFVN